MFGISTCSNPPLRRRINLRQPLALTNHQIFITSRILRRTEQNRTVMAQKTARAQCVRRAGEGMYPFVERQQQQFWKHRVVASKRALSGRRGAKQLVVVTTHKTLSAPQLSTAALTPSTSVTTASPCIDKQKNGNTIESWAEKRGDENRA